MVFSSVSNFPNLIAPLQAIPPVSYTHLDVYKRQTLKVLDDLRVDIAHPVDRLAAGRVHTVACLLYTSPQKAVYEGGLAVVDVGDDSDVADVLLLHESSFGSFLGAEIIALCGDDGGVRPQTAPGRQTDAAEGVRCARPDEAAGATTPRGAPRTPCVPR